MGNIVAGLGFGGTTAIGSAAALGGSLLSYKGQEDTNDANYQIANQTNQFNSAEAARNREFQSQMFDKATELDNTAVQRRVSDLRAAGINPMLAAAPGAGASTPGVPGGSSASGVAAHMDNPGRAFERFGGDVIASMSAASQIETQKKQQDVLASEVDVNAAKAENLRAGSSHMGVDMDRMRQDIAESVERTRNYASQRSLNVATADKAAQEVVNMQATLDQIDASVKQMQSMVKLNDAQIKALAAQTGKSYAEIKEIQQRVSADLPHVEKAQIQARTTLDRLKQPEAMNNAGLHSTWIGSMSTLLRAFNPLVGIVGR